MARTPIAPAMYRPAEGFSDSSRDLLDDASARAPEAGDLAGLVKRAANALHHCVTVTWANADDFWSVWLSEKASRDSWLVAQGPPPMSAGMMAPDRQAAEDAQRRDLEVKAASDLRSRVAAESKADADAVATNATEAMLALDTAIDNAAYEASLPASLARAESDLGKLLAFEHARADVEGMLPRALERLYESSVKFGDGERTRAIESAGRARLTEIVGQGAIFYSKGQNAKPPGVPDLEVQAAVRLLARMDQERRKRSMPAELRAAVQLRDQLRECFRRLLGCDARLGGPMTDAEFQLRLSSGTLIDGDPLRVEPDWSYRLISPTTRRVLVPGWSPLKNFKGERVRTPMQATKIA